MVEISTTARPFPFRWMKDVEEIKVDWLWYPYIPRGGVTMLVGDGGYGKSTLTVALAADLSEGRALPGQDPLDPMKILMLSAEDGLGQIVKRKLRDLKANMNNIAGYEEHFALGAPDIARMVSTMKEVDATVVFLDPLVVYMGGGVDINKSTETRAVLKLLDKVAKESNTAIVVVHHVRKQGVNAAQQHKTMGSADIVNASRSTILVDVSKSGQHYMAHVKSNWSKKGPSLAYAFTGDSFEWLGEYSGSEREVGDEELSKTPRGKAKQFLFDLLKDGPKPAVEVMVAAAAVGLTERTLLRAKKGLAVSVKNPGLDTGWVWDLIDREGLSYVPTVKDTFIGNKYVGEAPPPPPPSAEELLEKLGRGVPPMVLAPSPTVAENKPAISAPLSPMEKIIAEAKAKLGSKNG